MATSKAQIKAVRNQEQKDPARTRYDRARRNARVFINDNSRYFIDHSNKSSDRDYKNDLLELKEKIENKLKEL